MNIRLSWKVALGIVTLWGSAGVFALGEESPPTPSSAPAKAKAGQTSLPASVEALAMALQVVRELERYVTTKDLATIHNEDMLLNTATSGLLNETNLVAGAGVEQSKVDLVAFARQVTSLHTAADKFQQKESETELQKVLAAFDKVKTYFPRPTLIAAREVADKFMCPMHPTVVGTRKDSCEKCGMELDQSVRLLPFRSANPLAPQQTVRASIRTAGPYALGLPVRAYLRLQNNYGGPVSFADLIETHTKKIHLLIIDPSLKDYHHEHPQPTSTPGEYLFYFTPRKPGAYRAWADLRPHPMGLQEYGMTDIAASTAPEPLTDRTVSFKTTLEGLTYELTFAEMKIRVGKPALAKLRITNSNGSGFTQLEPIMATFAHLVGFHEDYKTVLHMHPKGLPILDPTARGGPELEFQIYALKPGFVRLFAQVQIDGQSKFAPFGLEIVP